MNSQDYIHKAVELADGWELEGDEMFLQVTLLSGDKYNVLGCHVTDPFPPSLDALAAQLVRQVDALPDIFFESDNDGVAFVCSETENIIRYDRFADSQYGGRTLNTIKAIVDSGVLDGG